MKALRDAFDATMKDPDFVKEATDDAVAKRFARKFGEGGVKEYLYNLLSTKGEAGYDWSLESEVGFPSGTLHQGRVALSREWTQHMSIVGSYLGRVSS